MRLSEGWMRASHIGLTISEPASGVDFHTLPKEGEAGYEGLGIHNVSQIGGRE